MPYVNIKKPKLQASVAKLVGKAQGEALRLAQKQLNPILSNLRRQGCSTKSAANQAVNKLNAVKKGVRRADRTISKFKKLPKTLKVPLQSIDTLLKVVKKVPIPQSVPPGFGLPIFLSTLYADLLHLLKERKVQIEELVESIEAVLDTPTTTLKSIDRLISRADAGLLSCKVQAQLEEEISSGSIDKKQLKDLGILDSEEIFIFSTLLPKLVGNADLNDDGELKDSRSLREVANDAGIDLDSATLEEKRELSNKIKQRGVVSSAGTTTSTAGITSTSTESNASSDTNTILQGQSTTTLFGTDNQELNFQTAYNILNTAIDSLTNSKLSESTTTNLNNLLNVLKDINEEEKINQQQTGELIYVASNGSTYILDIVDDPKSSYIAPRKIAVAKDPIEGVVVLKGPPTFATDRTVLLDEIKFRLDNQLP